MGPRSRLVLAAAAMIAVAAAVTITIAAESNGGGGAAAQVTDVNGVEAARSAFKGAARPPAPVRGFALRNQDGKLVTLRGLRGRVVVLTPMYTHCQDTCPLVAQQIRAALQDLSGDERSAITALALSVDPANDSADSARRFLIERRVRGYLDFLVGSETELQPVWKAYGFSRQTNAQEHNSYVLLLDRGGHQRVSFPVDYLTPESLAHDLGLLVAQRG